MPTVERFRPGQAAAMIAAIERDGAAVLEGALSTVELAQLKVETAALVASTPTSEGLFHGRKTKRVGAMVGRSEVCRTMALQPDVLAAMDHFFLPHCMAYQLNLSQLIAIGPDEQRQITHADDAMFPFVRADFQAMINVMWAVDDFTAENGGTHIAPGSHHWDKQRRATPAEIIQAEMPAGACLIYLGSTRHGGGANRTALARRGLVISYCLGWLRQSENQYLAISRDQARTFPERLQRLLGYFVHEPNLGMVEGQDPILCLRDDPEAWSAGFKDFLPEQTQKFLELHYAKSSASPPLRAPG